MYVGHDGSEVKVIELNLYSYRAAQLRTLLKMCQGKITFDHYQRHDKRDLKDLIIISYLWHLLKEGSIDREKAGQIRALFQRNLRLAPGVGEDEAERVFLDLDDFVKTGGRLINKALPEASCESDLNRTLEWTPLNISLSTAP